MAGQTLTEIRAALDSAGLSPQHRFGQNFLIDLNLMRKVAATAELRPTDLVLEVGPGTGSLTELLLESGAQVVAVEIDRGLAALLRARFSSEPRLTLIHADALAGKHSLAPDLLAALNSSAVARTSDAPSPEGRGSGQSGPPPASHRKLVANLPYQIATPLIIELLLLNPPFERLVCTIQKEVGQRLAAAEDTEEYGPVSIIAQTLARVEVVAHLPPEAFWPRPKIDSVLLKITPLAHPEIAAGDARDFALLVQRAFQQRRKTLRRTFRDWGISDPASLLEPLGLRPESRPEQLSPRDWQRLHAAGLRAPA